jgi:hypothetical protein
LFFVLSKNCNGQDVALFNPNDEIILNDITYNGNVYIAPLTTVIIPKGTVVKLKSSKFFEIQPSAKLIVRGEITYDDLSPAADPLYAYFYGIRVMGISNQSSPGIGAILNGGFPWGNPFNNGVLIVDGGVISYANAAIASFSGGIVYVNNASIHHFRSFGITFVNENLNTISEKPTLAIIQNTIFENDQFLDTYYGLGMNSISAGFVHGVKVSNCTIINGVTEPDAFSSGISLEQCGIIVSNCKFSDFNNSITQGSAIRSQKFISSIRGYITIRNNEFNNCRTSILLDGDEHAQVYDNLFNITEIGRYDGIKCFGVNSFNIRYNTFNNYGNFIGNNGHLSTALTISSSGDQGNMIRGNTFNNCLNGIKLIDDNTGLQLKCNDFIASNIYTSMNIGSIVYKLSIPLNKRGISDQGTNIAGDISGKYLPGNLFSQACSGGSGECDFYLSLDHPKVNYYYYNNEQNRTYPTNHTQNELIPLKARDATIELYSTGCTYNFQDISEILSLKNSAQLLKNDLLPFSSIDSIQKNIKYLAQNIEVEYNSLLWHVVNNSNVDSLYTFLKNNETAQGKLWLAELYLEDGKYDSAQITLNQIIITDQESYSFLNKQYLLRIVSHLGNTNNICNFSSTDLNFFNDLANSYSPVSFRAAKILQLIDSVCNSSQLLSLNHNSPLSKKINEQIIIGPNPSSNYILINTNLSANTYSIVDFTGRNIQNGLINENGYLSIESLKEGLYHLLIYKKDGNLLNARFVKSN